MRGTGTADVPAMPAHPVGPAKSPGAMNALFEERGLDSLMVPETCKPEGFDRFRAGMDAMANLRGVNVSIPFRSRIMDKVKRVRDAWIKPRPGPAARGGWPSPACWSN